ncbi:MAG TPA: C1 family peptidase, partial [Bacteroidales bacterium]|nr:C1 family peptidase [Bacteroidales bacterium]
MIALLVVASSAAYSQAKEKKSDSTYVFSVVKQLPATSVKNQYRSGTCWSYSAISFIESELL